MPALVPRLSKEEAGVVVEYVRLLSPGYETYTLYCANCHGVDGRGVGSFAESVPLPTMAFDKAYLGAVNPEFLCARVWHMIGQHKPSMPHFADVLNPEEANTIIEYLKASN